MASDVPVSASVVRTDVAARVATVSAIAFLAILGSLHFLKPEFDPSWRLISEYEVGRFGWLMSLAFFCWGGSVLALQRALRTSLETTAGKIGRWLLGVVGIAMIASGVFTTTASTDPNITTEAVVHALSAGVVVLTLPVAASLVARGLTRHEDWAPIRRRLVWATLLVWFSLLAFFAWSIVFSIINPTVGQFGPQLLLGWPNRFVAIAYSIWVLVLAQRATRVG